MSLSKRIGLLFFLVILTSQFLFTSILASPLDNKFQALQDIKQEIDDNNKKISLAEQGRVAVVQQIDALDQQIAEAQGKTVDLNRRLDGILAERNAVRARADAIKTSIAKTEEELRTAEAKLAVQRELLNNRLRQVYKTGGLNFLQIFLSIDNYADLVNHFSFMQLIVNRDARLVSDLAETKSEIQAKKDQLAQENEQLLAEWNSLSEQEKQISVVKEQLAKEQKAAQTKLAQQQVLLAQVEREKKSYQNAEEVLVSASALVTAQIKELEKKYGYSAAVVQPTSDPAVSASGFRKPTAGDITSPFGMRWHPVLKKYRLHTGVDFGAPTGTPIVASRSGRVILAGWVRGYGRTVILDHGGGLTTLYAHASALVTTAGQTVQQGQTIALVGESGLATGPNLHFEIRQQGEPRDPRPFLQL